MSKAHESFCPIVEAGPSAPRPAQRHPAPAPARLLAAGKAVVGPLAVAALTALAALTSPASAADDHIALFKTVSGDVSIVRNDTTLPAAAGTTLFVADRLVSGAGASAGVVFKDGTTLAVGPSTQILVRDYVFEPKNSKYAFSVLLDKGSAVYTSGQIAKLAPDAVKVSSPTATVGVRGTRFLIGAE